ncbi:hypothetical protein LCX93_00390 [Sulfurimonas sp. SWIR-19]|uniref:hypothetical protein n=1 Tax=Sulfurimonas sp. SWIR-19 TaxID=2878390 RepID=UPI001CF5335C|nr:hypothetical protein [Sulfurimonas sp. SWIR-19]UCN00405.1 hypothetical protein LCX93_00390 [Sulfurimonas sp. SWIR-19]
MKIFLLFICFFTVLLAQDSQTKENEYTLGEGVQVGTLPLYIGGYFSADYTKKSNTNRYRVDDIALLAYGNYNKFSYLAEMEYKEFYTYTDFNATHTIERNTRLHTERLYIDYTFNENFMLRGGKYNSPIGFWNLLPINVLRDTTSNPVSTSILFPKFSTGLYGSYSKYGDDELQIDVILQHNDDLDANYNNYKTDEHYGAGVSYTHNDLNVKLNIGMFDNVVSDTSSTHLYYAVASLQYDAEHYKITSEFGTQRNNKGFTTKYAGYLQGGYRFNEKHLGIVRLESYSQTDTNRQDNIAIVGYTYRPLYPVAFKAEYQFHSLHDENQFLFSWSVLF